jgi:hypothetical protein
MDGTATYLPADRCNPESLQTYCFNFLSEQEVNGLGNHGELAGLHWGSVKVIGKKCSWLSGKMGGPGAGSM